MTPYAYRAVSPAGQIVRGRLDAHDLPDLEHRLARLGLELLQGRPAPALHWPGRQPVPRRELINFCFHLEQFLQAGVPILDSLADLRDSLEHPRFRPVVAQLITAIENIPDGFALYDETDHLILCNRRYHEVHASYPRQGRAGRTLEVPPERRHLHGHLLLRE